MPLPLISVLILWGLLCTSAGKPLAVERPMAAMAEPDADSALDDATEAAKKVRAALKKSLSDPPVPHPLPSGPGTIMITSPAEHEQKETDVTSATRNSLLNALSQNNKRRRPLP